MMKCALIQSYSFPPLKIYTSNCLLLLTITLRHYHILYCNVLLQKTKSLFARSFVVYMKCEMWRGYASQKILAFVHKLCKNFASLPLIMAMHFSLLLSSSVISFYSSRFFKRIESIEISYELPVDRFPFAKLEKSGICVSCATICFHQNNHFDA